MVLNKNHVRTTLVPCTLNNGCLGLQLHLKGTVDGRTTRNSSVYKKLVRRKETFLPGDEVL